MNVKGFTTLLLDEFIVKICIIEENLLCNFAFFVTQEWALSSVLSIKLLYYTSVLWAATRSTLAWQQWKSFEFMIKELTFLSRENLLHSISHVSKLMTVSRFCLAGCYPPSVSEARNLISKRTMHKVYRGSMVCNEQRWVMLHSLIYSTGREMPPLRDISCQGNTIESHWSRSLSTSYFMFCQNELWTPTILILYSLATWSPRSSLIGGWALPNLGRSDLLKLVEIKKNEECSPRKNTILQVKKNVRQNPIGFTIILYFHRNTTSRQWKQ